MTDNRPPWTTDDIRELKDTLARDWQNWIYAGESHLGGDWAVSAEYKRLIHGRTERQVARDPETLLVVLEDRERQFASIPELNDPVSVVGGLANTKNV